ncbi:MAG: single-stranded DNA-binding protein [Candidatus Thorarchaeota archaeon]|jgi:single-strand DNA-binding protein
MFNEVILVGRCGTDPEVSKTNNNTPVANLKLVTQAPKDPKPEWHSLAFFGGKAEVIAQHAHKGKLMLVKGELRHSSYTSNDGTHHRNAEVVVSHFRFLGDPSS